MGENAMIARYVIFLILLACASSSVYARDCLVHTTPRKLLSNHPQLLRETLLLDNGRYSAILKNGDFALASFSRCDLGMSVHYFSAENLDKNQLKTKLKILSKYFLPSDEVAARVIPQIASLTEKKLGEGAILDGIGDQYKVTVIPFAGHTYRLHIQYDWIPPEF